MSENDTIDGPNPTVTQVASPAPTNAGSLTNPTRSPLQSDNPRIRAAWQCALATIRNKNRAGRPPLA